MNILIIAHSFFPSTKVSAIRPTKFAKYLQKFGHNVSVFCSSSDPDKVSYHEKVKVYNNYCRLNKTSIVNSSRNLNKKKSYLKFLIRDILFPIDKYFWWYIKRFNRLIDILKQDEIDKIIVTGDPFSSFFVTYLLNKKTKTEYFLDYRDPWNGCKSANKQTFIRKISNNILENKILKNAKGITATTNEMLDVINAVYKNKNQFIQPNGFDKDDISYNSALKIDLDKKKFNFLYTGKFSIKRPDYNPLSLVEAFIAFKEKYNIEDSELILIGNSDSETIKMIKEKKCSDIRILGFKSRTEILQYQKEANGLIHFYYPLTHIDTVSLKIYEYIAAKKPIITFNLKEGALHDLISNNKLGISEVNNNKDLMADAFYNIYSSNLNFNSKNNGKFNIENSLKNLNKWMVNSE